MKNFKFTLLTLIVFISYCSSQTQKQDPVPIAVKETIVTDGVNPNSLQIGSGSAEGTSAEIPSDALPEGSSLSLDVVLTTPDSFSKAAAESGGKLKKVSSPVQISAQDSNGKNQEVLSSPMSLSIPMDTSLSLEEAPTNICLLLTNSLGVFSWNSDELIQDGTKISVQSNYLGIFQLYSCQGGTVGVLPSVKSASKEGVAASANQVVLSVDYKYFATGSNTLCLVAYDDNTRVIQAFTKRISAQNVLQKYTLLPTESIFSDISGDTLNLAFIVTNGQSCNYKNGDIFLLKKLVFNSIMVFKKFQKTNFTLGGELTLGEGALQTSKHYLQINASGKAKKEEFFCISHKNTSGLIAVSSKLDLDGKIGGQSKLVVHIPGASSIVDGTDVSMYFGVDCNPDKTPKYSLSLSLKNELVEIVPFSFDLNISDLSKAKALSNLQDILTEYGDKLSDLGDLSKINNVSDAKSKLDDVLSKEIGSPKISSLDSISNILGLDLTSNQECVQIFASSYFSKTTDLSQAQTGYILQSNLTLSNKSFQFYLNVLSDPGKDVLFDVLLTPNATCDDITGKPAIMKNDLKVSGSISF